MTPQELHTILKENLPIELHKGIEYLLNPTEYNILTEIKKCFEERELSIACAKFESKHTIPLLYLFSQKVIQEPFSEMMVTIKNAEEFHYGYFRKNHQNTDMCFIDTHAGINPFSVWVDLTDTPQNIQVQINQILSILYGQGWSNLDFSSDLSWDFTGVEKITSGRWDAFTINGTDKTIINTIPKNIDLYAAKITNQSSFIAHNGKQAGKSAPDIELTLYQEGGNHEPYSISFVLVYLHAHGFNIQSPTPLNYDWKKCEKDCLWEIAQEIYGGSRSNWLFLF